MDPHAERKSRRAALARQHEARTAAGRHAPALVRWRRLRRRVGSLLLELLAPPLLRVLAATWRVEPTGPGIELLRSQHAFVIAMWHGRMLAAMPLRWHRGRGLQVLVSPSDDGELATRALRRFGYRVVRGSLSRGGARALREMRDLLAGGGQLVITPDGPRGPRHGMNVGAAWLARATAAPLLPLALAVDRAWRLSSWDRFVIPKPFARLCVVYGDPLPVPEAASDAALETIAAELRRRLLEAERLGFARLGVPHDLGPDGG